MAKKYWTKEKCITEAKKYQYRNDFKKANYRCYSAALRHGWLDQCCAHMKILRKSWTLERCKEDALEYKTRTEWARKSKKAYDAACRRNWLDQCCSHMKYLQKPSGYWTLDACKSDALKYKTRAEWSKKSNGAFNSAYKHGWIKDCCNHMKKYAKQNPKWTLEKCKVDALRYNSRAEWIKNSNGHRAAYRNGWLDQCCSHMKKLHNSWTLEKCKVDALKYRTRSEWAKRSSAYEIAKINKWLDQCCSHMKFVQMPSGYWTLDRCKEDALRYGTRREWARKSVSAYQIARRQGKLDQCCAHMKRIGGTSNREKALIKLLKEYLANIQTNVRFSTKNYFKDKPHIKRLELDIYIPELRKGIEFNGKYWHSSEGIKRGRPNWPKQDVENYHNLKKEFFKSRNIDYIEIWENDWNEDPDKCINKCLEFLNG